MWKSGVRRMLLQIFGYQMQLLRGGLGLPPTLHVHDPRDLGVGLVGADQMQNLQLRGRQLLTGGKARKPDQK